MRKTNIELTPDLDYEINKICKKRKESINKVIIMILTEWLEDGDNIKYLERLPKNVKSDNRRIKK